MVEKIKRINRALLELILGILFLGIVIEVLGILFVGEKLLFSLALWMGILAAVLSAIHMYKTLDQALSMGASAYSKATSAAAIRYFCWALFLGVIMYTEVMNPLYAFIGLLTLKVAAYLQPFTHKFCNYIFHETDPIPEAIPWDDET